MAIDDKRLEGHELAVFSSGVLELLPVIADPRHSRQRAAHPRRPLPAAHHDAVRVVIELSDRTLFKRGKERDRDVALVDQPDALVAARQLVSRSQTGPDDLFGRTPALFTGKMPEPVARVAMIDVRSRADADPDASCRLVVSIQSLRRPQQQTRLQVLEQDRARETRGMQSLGRVARAPRELRKPLGRIAQRDLLAFHARHEIFPDVVDGRDVIAAFLHHRVSGVPPESDKGNATLDAKTRFFENFAARLHRHARADGVVDQNRRLVRIDASFDQLQRAVLFALFANEQAAVAPSRLQDAGLENGNAGHPIRRDLSFHRTASTARARSVPPARHLVTRASPPMSRASIWLTSRHATARAETACDAECRDAGAGRAAHSDPA